MQELLDMCRLMINEVVDHALAPFKEDVADDATLKKHQRWQLVDDCFVLRFLDQKVLVLERPTFLLHTIVIDYCFPHLNNERSNIVLDALLGCETNNRVLIIDDCSMARGDFWKILPTKPPEPDAFDELEQALFGETVDKAEAPLPAGEKVFELYEAFDSDDAYHRVAAQDKAGLPIAMAFVDIFMPPKRNGIETIKWIWQDFPNIEMVVFSAPSFYSQAKIRAFLGNTHRLHFLHKPSNKATIRRVATELVEKWNFEYQHGAYLQAVEKAFVRFPFLERPIECVFSSQGET